MSTIHVTVAAIAEQDERFLLVAERIDGRLVVNQPAGHWEPGETLEQAVVRETLEETGWSFRPDGLVGIYQWQHPNGQDTFLRFAFHGRALDRDPRRELDSEIEEVLWWTAPRIRTASLPLRSPQVLRCVEDFLRGERYDPDCLKRIPAR